MISEPFVCVPTRIMRNMAISPTAFRLYCLLIDYNSEERGCFPSQETLQCDLCAKNVRTVQRAMKELVSANLIEIDRRYDGLHNRYKLSVQATKMSGTGDKNVRQTPDTTKMSPSDTTKMSGPPDKNVASYKEQEPREQDIETTEVVSSTNGEIAIPETKPTPKATPPKLPDGFPAFWKAYPSGHGTKQVALNEWAKLKPDAATQSEILYGVAKWSASERWTEGYIVDAERFLKRRMWEDSPPPPRPVVLHGRAADLQKQDQRLMAIMRGETA